MHSASESQLTSNSAVITKEREGTREKKRKGMEWAIIGSREGKERERDSVGMGERERERKRGREGGGRPVGRDCEFAP